MLQINYKIMTCCAEVTRNKFEKKDTHTLVLFILFVHASRSINDPKA